MIVVIDYFKNNKLYTSELSDLVFPIYSDYQVDNKLKQAVKRFDDLTFEKRKILGEYASKIQHDDQSLIYNFDDGVSVKYYYNIFKEFVIEAYMAGNIELGSLECRVKHILSNSSNIIKIKNGHNYEYVPFVDLINMSEAYTNDSLTSGELDYINEKLTCINDNLENFYNKKLIRKK